MVLVMGVVSCRMTEIKDMITYFENTQDFYKEKFNIDKILSRSTISRTLDTIDADVVGKVIVDIMCKIHWTQLEIF